MRKSILMAALLAATTLAAPAFALPERADAGDDPRPARVFNRDRGGEGAQRSGDNGADRAAWQGRAQPQAAPPPRPERSTPQPTVMPQVEGDRRGSGMSGGGMRGGEWRGAGAMPQAARPQPQAPSVADTDRPRRDWNNGNGGGEWRGNRGNDGNGDWQGRPPPPAPVAQIDPRQGGGDDRRGNDREGDGWRGEHHDDRQAEHRGNDHDWHRGDNGGGWNRPGNGNWNNRWGYNGGLNNNWRTERQYDNDSSRWNRDWRHDRRYDWQGYRSYNRDFFRQDRYYAPFGYNYGYRRFSIGITLGAPFFSSRYWIDQPYDYRLPDAYPPYRWVRYYNDVLLVDTRSGYVVDVINDFFW